MTALKQDLKEFIQADAGVVAGLGTPTSVFHKRASTGAKFNYVVFHLISDPGHHDMSGANAFAEPMFQIEVWGTDPASVDQVADDLRTLLDGYSGAFGSHQMQGVFLRNRREDIRQQANSSNRSVYVVQLDFELVFTRQ